MPSAGTRDVTVLLLGIGFQAVNAPQAERVVELPRLQVVTWRRGSTWRSSPSAVHGRVARRRNLARTGYSVVSDTISDMQAATAPHVWFRSPALRSAGSARSASSCSAAARLSRSGKVAESAPWMLASLGWRSATHSTHPCQVLTTPAAPRSSTARWNDRRGRRHGCILGARVHTRSLWRRLQVLPQWRRLKP